jgi:hypothetical protein
MITELNKRPGPWMAWKNHCKKMVTWPNSLRSDVVRYWVTAQWTRYYIIKQVDHCYATNKQVTVELLEAVFSMRSDPRLSTSKVSLSDINNHDIPGLYFWLKHMQRLWKLLQETRDPTCKTEVNWMKKTIRKMTRRKHLNGGNKNRELWCHTLGCMAYCEVSHKEG